jgi:hypothetical protein
VHAARPLADHVEFIGAARRFVALLDQQPLLLASLLPPAAHQRPAAVQLLAIEPERQLARAIAAARARDAAVGRPRAFVPHDDRPGAVVAGRNLPFERRVFDRMILDVHGQTLHRRIEARPLRHRP